VTSSSGCNNYVAFNIRPHSCHPMWTTAVWCSLERRRLLTLSHVLSTTAGNSTIICYDSCIHWLDVSEWVEYLSFVWLCTDASATKLHGTSWTIAHQFLTFSATVYILPAVTNFPSHANSSIPTAVGLILLPAWLSETLAKDMRGSNLAADSFRPGA